MNKRIKERERDTENSEVSEHANETGHVPVWNQVKFIDCDTHCCTHRVKEAINIRLHPINKWRQQNRNSRSMDAYTVKKLNS